jgi:hypothetical protein
MLIGNAAFRNFEKQIGEQRGYTPLENVVKTFDYHIVK